MAKLFHFFTAYFRIYRILKHHPNTPKDQPVFIQAFHLAALTFHLEGEK